MNSSAAITDKEFVPAQVECYSGYKISERPVAFTFHGRRMEISEILDRWYEGGIDHQAPVIDYFKVKTADGSVFILRYEKEADEWSICRGERSILMISPAICPILFIELSVSRLEVIAVMFLRKKISGRFMTLRKDKTRSCC